MHITSVQCEVFEILAESRVSKEVMNIMEQQSLLANRVAVILLANKMGFHEMSDNAGYLSAWLERCLHRTLVSHELL